MHFNQTRLHRYLNPRNTHFPYFLIFILILILVWTLTGKMLTFRVILSFILFSISFHYSHSLLAIIPLPSRYSISCSLNKPIVTTRSTLKQRQCSQNDTMGRLQVLSISQPMFVSSKVIADLYKAHYLSKGISTP